MDSDEKVRVNIQFCVKLGDNLEETKRKLNVAYGSECPHRNTISRWYHYFKQGGTETARQQNGGRPENVVNPRLLKAITDCLVENPKTSLSLLSAELGESKGYLQHIINTRLEFKKVLAKWVPKLLSSEQKQKRVDDAQSILDEYGAEWDFLLDNLLTVDETWIYYEPPQTRRSASEWQLPGQSPPEVERVKMTPKKIMATVFWNKDGIVHIDYLKSGNSINKEYYVKLLDIVNAKIPARKRRKVQFLQDNCPSHKAKISLERIAQLGWTLLKHPPYSPDLAPSDYYLFRNLKNDILKNKFTHAEDVETQISDYFASKSSAWYFRGFDMFKTQLTNVILNKGSYY